MILTGILLAAGSSRRFGPSDKLLHPFRGRPLIAHAAQAMRQARLDHRVAVISNPALSVHLQGFQVVRIVPAAMADSLRAGLAAVTGTDRLLIALGDMPFVTAAHLDRVARTATPDRPAASVDDGPPMPPACFPAAWLPRLAELSGDQGAGRLLRDLSPDALVAGHGLLGDIDRPGDLPG
ncbi:nucleotidyltransferase family protein [Paracoccus homiensis]|uniref:nucleotidyltransferase family protein n=1 Tax=Paracoccus homiensis TaxID=364199 RepID=UPI00398CF39E